MDELFEQEFQAHFHIIDSIDIQLLNEDASLLEELCRNLICFTKEHFVAGLRFPIPSLMKKFLYFSEISPA